MTRSLLDIARNKSATRAKPRHLESEQQRLFVKRVRLDARTKDCLFCSVPNGGRRGKVEAGILKAEGTSAGVPDLLFFDPVSQFCGLAIEFKIKGNPPTSSQLEWHRKLAMRRWRVTIAYSADEAWEILLAYLCLRVS